MGTKRKRVQLPRLMVLALNRRQLAEFAGAVERVGHLAAELADVVDRLRAKAAPRSSKTSTGDGTANAAGKAVANEQP